MSRRVNTLFEIRDSTGHTYEVWAATEKEALLLARCRKWADQPTHKGIRRILHKMDGEPYPVLQAEANYLTALRRDFSKERAEDARLKESMVERERTRPEREAAENAAALARHSAALRRLAEARTKREALVARLGLKPPLLDTPIYDPDAKEWI